MTSEASSPLIYLDHNATTPVPREVAEAMEPCLRAEFGHPSGDHVLGRRARQAVDQARAQVATLIHAGPEEVVFTSGGTESNNLAIRGAATEALAEQRWIVTSAVEHPATFAPCALLEAELATAARAYGAVVHTDAAQAIGEIPASVEDLGVDLLSIASHKCHGPKGIDALYVRRGTPLSPVLLGAGQERGVRPGTENVAGVVGLGEAARLALSHLATDAFRIAGLRDELWAALSATVPGILRHTRSGACLPHTLLVSFPGVLGADVLAQVPQLAASTGSACHAGEHTPNATLLAMGIEPQVALGAVWLSLGRDTTPLEVATAAELLARAHAALSSTNPSPTSATRGRPR